MRGVRLFVLLVALMVPLAGCLKPNGTTDDDANDTPVEPATEPNATLPDGRGVAVAFNETNKTEEGVGGVEHKHDYWKGETRVVVYDDEAFFRFFPIYPDGEGSQPKSVVYLKLPQPALIYEGATTVEVLVEPLEVCVDTDLPCAPHPLPPGLTLAYRTAASDQFVDAGAITPGTPLVIPVNAKETDMPHSVSSLWAFAIEADTRQDIAALRVVITAVRGANVVDWPGHPDFYADTDQRVIVDRAFSVHRQGIEEGILYGSASTWVHPDKLVSYGTGRLDVFINITSATASNGAEPTGFFLEYHNATILDAEDRFNERIDDEHKGRQFDHTDYHFVIEVDPAGMDGPYQSGSLWGFRPVATFAETPVASLCPGCFAYDIEYTMKIVAHKAEGEQARLNG